MSSVISVENLGKKYFLSHQGKRESYTALREVIADTCRSWGRRALSPFVPARGGDCREREEFWALRDACFEVRQGERVAIIGRNGAGKSTLLKILSRITEPSTGRVRVRGRVASLLEVGTGFHPELTGRENIFLNGAILGMSRAEINKKFDAIVDFAEMEKFLDTPVKRYSSGMYVRLAFSVAAHIEPDILIVDEVLAVGDLIFQKKCFNKLKEDTHAGQTVLLVSHNMQALNSLSHTAICLESGAIVDSGKTADVTMRYLQKFHEADSADAGGSLRHLVFSGTIIIRRVQMFNSKKVMTTSFHFREPFSLLFTFEVLAPVVNARVGFAVCTMEGTRLSTTHHTDSGHLPLSLDRGLYCLDVEVENQLTPGQYVIEGGIHDMETAKGLDSIPNAITFSVVNFSEDGTSKHDQFNSSYFYLPTKWQPPRVVTL